MRYLKSLTCQAPRPGNALSFVEVLVILTVITLLIAIFIPKIIRGRQDAFRTGCLSNLKCLGLSIQQYSSSMYYGAWMNAAPTPSDLVRDTPQKLLEDLNLLYDKGRGLANDEKLFQCRFFEKSRPWPIIPMNGDPGNPTVDYGLAVRLDNTSPANMIIMADVPGGPKRKGAHGDLWSRNHNPAASSIATSDQNCLFMDSHIKNYQTANPPDDADTYPGDTGSIYCGATPTTVTPGSSTDTLIFNTDDASIRP